MADIRKTVGDLDEWGVFDGTELMEVFPASEGKSYKKAVGTAAERDIGTGLDDVPDNEELNTRLATTSNLGTAATRDVGDGATQIRLNSDLPYEVGTWTPIFSSSSGSFGSITYNRQNGRYTRIGNRVLFSLELSTDSVDKGTASGTLIITAPLVAGPAPTRMAAEVGNISNFDTDVAPRGAAVIQGGTSIVLFKNRTDESAVFFSPSDMRGGSSSDANRVSIAGSYIV
jgi:hypothetical protein